MTIGIPKEIKEQEQRVGLLPSTTQALVARGHTVLVQKNAGVGSGYSDEEYSKAGARIVESAEEIFQQADMIVKVKEPLPPEWPLLRRGQILFTYLHLAASRPLTEALLNSGVTGVAYETIQIGKGSDAELRYIISDLGATFGHASTTPLFWRFTRSRNNPSNYANSKFFEKVKGNRVVLHFGGKNSGLMKDITVSDAQWLSSWLSQLSDQQLRDAFRAANYRPDEINLLAREIRERSTELLNLRPAEQIGRLR